jgi:adenine-specific DNA-methyltransferase
MSNVLDTLIGRVHESDPALANAISAEIKKLQNRREYGLVYEAHAPEGVRLWGKKILAGDIVNVLPPRGVMETKDNSLEW